MFPNSPVRVLPLLLLIALLSLSACASYFQPVQTSGAAPTPVISVTQGGVDNPNVFVDPAAFRTALLEALAARDIHKLQQWMTEPFLTGTWRADLSDSSAVEALKSLYTGQLGGENHLALVQNADLKALMGGKDPLLIPRSDSRVIDAFLVSGWGKDGRDEAVLFIARQQDNSLKWIGWMQVKGGFSGARLGGIQFYQSDAFGFSVYLPKGFEIPPVNPNEVFILGPGQGHPTDNRVGVFITAEPANGRTAEQMAAQALDEAKTLMGADYKGDGIIGMSIDGEPAYSAGGLPGQDLNRQLFIVHNGQLYKLMFVPDSPKASAYSQMEDAYAMIVNTFHFTLPTASPTIAPAFSPTGEANPTPTDIPQSASALAPACFVTKGVPVAFMPDNMHLL